MSFKDYKEAALGLLILLVPLSVIIGGIQSIIEAHTTPELSEAQLQEIQHEFYETRKGLLAFDRCEREVVSIFFEDPNHYKRLNRVKSFSVGVGKDNIGQVTTWVSYYHLKYKYERLHECTYMTWGM